MHKHFGMFGTFKGQFQETMDCEQFHETTASLAICSIPCTYNSLLATVYVQWHTRYSNFLPLGFIITSLRISYNMKAYEI